MNLSRRTSPTPLLALLFLVLLGSAALAQSGPRMNLEDEGLLPRLGPFPGNTDVAPPSPPPEPIAGFRGASSSPRRAIMLAGYWPPSNEAIRRFSASPQQNPGGWIGSNWEGRGYDVYAFFPEFTPANCSNCGQGTGDLEVDYQDTTNDFFPLADSIEPVAIITFSRGFIDMSWELETNQFNRSNWIGDFTAPFFPTPSPPDASVPAGTLRPTTLPVNNIASAVNSAGLGLNSYVCVNGDGGGFLSEFMAYLGVWYQSIHSAPNDPARCVAAGHVHVGGNVSWPNAREAARVTLRTVIDHVNTIIEPPGGSIASCGPGAVNAGCGPTEDVLFVNGSVGGPARVEYVNRGAPLTISMSEPSSMNGDGMQTKLCLYAFQGIPTPADEVLLPLGFGPMCFGPASIATQQPAKTWNSLGRVPKLGPHTAPGAPPLIPDSTRLDIVNLPMGLNQTIQVTLQALVEDRCSQGSFPVSVTNGLVLRVD